MTGEWPLWPEAAEPAGAQPGQPPAVAAQPDEPQAAAAPSCPNCGRATDPAAWFCEACGHPLVPTAPAPAPAPATDAPSTQTRRLGVRVSQLADCPSCGGTVGADGYCQTCGAKAPSPRDHFSSAPAPWVGGVCDKGRQHHRNEDAMALWAEGDRAVLVVCDGVSTSIDSDVAALAAAEKARDVLVSLGSDGVAGAGSRDAAIARALVTATAEANQAVIATTAADSTNAASATFAAAVVVGDRVHFANLGDSRVYLLCEAERVLLSEDDSLAQAFIAEGMPRAEAEALPRAHAITKWLGRDAVEVVPRTGVRQVPGPGWLVVCSDGLWNYASAPDDLAAQVLAAAAGTTEPAEIARRLVVWANEQGGHDNITVALARVGGPTGNAAGNVVASLVAAPSDQEKESAEHG